MAAPSHKIIVLATPTAPILSELLHALQQHEPDLEVSVITRETSVKLPFTDENNHNHCHGPRQPQTSGISHLQLSFHDRDFVTYFRGKEVIISCLTGSDIHFTGPFVEAASKAGVKHFIPSKCALDTSNSKIRDLIPPYQTRYDIQQTLKGSGLNCNAIYSGISLDDGMKTDGVLGIDALWGSVVDFPHNSETKLAISTLKDLSSTVVDVATGRCTVEGNELWTSSFQLTLNELVEVVEAALDKKIDRYEGNFQGAKKEAEERMKRGFFDGGVALMGRVAVWDDKVNAWEGWKGKQGTSQSDWKDIVGKVVTRVRNREIGGDGCGC